MLFIQGDKEVKQELKPIIQWKKQKGGFKASMFIFGKQQTKHKFLKQINTLY
jgi:hypothetical protein